MQLKRFISAVFLFAAFSLGSAFGQNSVRVSNASGNVGSDVTVEVLVSAESDFLALDCTLNFDQTKLQIKPLTSDGVAVGADASGWSLALVDESSITAANSGGSIHISALDLSGADPIASGSDKRVVSLTFMVNQSATGNSEVSLEDVTLTGPTAQDLPGITAGAGVITITQGGAENTVWVADAKGSVGGLATVKTLVTVDQPVYGAQFDLMFDQTKLQIMSATENGVAPGKDAGGLTLPILDQTAIDAANSSGKLVVMMVELALANPLAAGQDKELLVVKFAVGESVAVGDIPITLGNVSFATTVGDTATAEIEITAVDGKVTIQAFEKGDVSGNGKVDIFDVLDLLKVISKKGTAVGDADVNADGKVDIFDLLALLTVLKGGS